MAMEALSSSNELFNFIIYDTISATPCSSSFNTITTSPNNSELFLNNNNNNNNNHDHGQLLDHHHHQLFLNGGDHSMMMMMIAKSEEPDEGVITRSNNIGSDSKLGIVGPSGKKKKRRRKVRVCKNKEEAETQRMTHIAVERNRRKQMNEHLAVLRSLMPDSYVQRGDQASIVGGAIEFVKELEHLLQSLEAQKLQLNLSTNNNNNNNNSNNIGGSENHDSKDQDKTIMEMMSSKLMAPPFSQFFVYPQYTWSQSTNKYTSKSMAAIADIEVTLIETHASIRILSRQSLRQLSKLVTGFQNLHLTILHLNVTTMSPLVLYSVSVKVEEECLLTSVDDIASAVHHMLRIIEEEAALS